MTLAGENKMIRMYCPFCGTRYLKKEIPDMSQYICMLCVNVAKTERKLILEQTQLEKHVEDLGIAHMEHMEEYH